MADRIPKYLCSDYLESQLCCYINTEISKWFHLAKWHFFLFLLYGLCGRGRGWEDLGEWHWNMYNNMYETNRQSRFDAQYWMLGAGALGRPRGMVWGGRREEGSGWGTHVYLWRIHFNIWQNQYNIVKLKKKKKKNLFTWVERNYKLKKKIPIVPCTLTLHHSC